MEALLELATHENFDAPRYLLANPDVARAGADAWDHFERHGRREGRRQFGIDAPQSLAWRQDRYRRFAFLLDAARGAGGDFWFPSGADAFPVSYGGRPHDLTDYEAESANGDFGPFVDEIAAHPDRFYLDVGCGRRRAILPNCLYLEVYPSPSADVVMEPACLYPIASESLDGIGCFAVLEHVAEPWQAAREFRRMLKPGGKVFIDWPFLQPVHGYPSHYYNATREGLRRLFDDGFDLIEIGTGDHQAPDHTLHWILGSLLDAIAEPALRAEIAAISVGDLAAAPPGGALWSHILTALPDAVREELACGNNLIAVKR